VCHAKTILTQRAQIIAIGGAMQARVPKLGLDFYQGQYSLISLKP
jgi:hypothetical protein